MPDLYHLFLALVFLLWLGSTAPDRNALRIVLCASLASWLVVDLITVRFDGAWKLVIPAAVETATILSLLRWACNRSGWKQVGALLVAWTAHVLCFADIQMRTDWIYSRYETVLGCVSAAQLLLFHDTYIHHLRRLGRWWGAQHNAGAVSAPSMSAAVLHHPGNSCLQPTSPCPTISNKT